MVSSPSAPIARQRLQPWAKSERTARGRRRLEQGKRAAVASSRQLMAANRLQAPSPSELGDSTCVSIKPASFDRFEKGWGASQGRAGMIGQPNARGGGPWPTSKQRLFFGPRALEVFARWKSCRRLRLVVGFIAYPRMLCVRAVCCLIESDRQYAFATLTHSTIHDKTDRRSAGKRQRRLNQKRTPPLRSLGAASSPAARRRRLRTA